MTQRTLPDAIAEIRRRAPLYLNATTVQKVGEQVVPVAFGDEHLFAMELPAWSLRAICEGKEGQTK